MYQKLQALLPEFLIERVTIDNLSAYESVFYNNKEYYRLTNGKPATREICEDTIDDFPPYNVCSIGVSQNGQSLAFLSILEGYPFPQTLYIGLLLVDDRFQKRSIGSKILTSLLKMATDMHYENLKLSVQENNTSGLNFWRKHGFYEVNRSACNGFDNLSMQIDLMTKQ